MDLSQRSIAFAKNRGLELHAWFNPFRVYSGQADGKLPPTHIVRTNPEFVRKFDRYLWLDPGLPAARSYAIDVIMDVVRRYDVDGIHIDDYFYPPPRKGISDFPDKATLNAQQAGGLKAEWRRDNINRFVRILSGRQRNKTMGACWRQSSRYLEAQPPAWHLRRG